MKRNFKLKEDIDYGDYPERMDPNLERKLSDPTGMYAQNPAFKRGEKDVQKLISSRFKTVVDNLRRATGQPNLSSDQVKSMIFGQMMMSTQNVMRIESRHKDRLEAIAIEHGIKQVQIDPDEVVIEAFLNRSPISISNFRYSEEEPSQKKKKDKESDDEIKQKYGSFDVEDLTDEEEFELEVHKRDIVNAIIQGSAKLGHYLFMKPEVKKQVDAIDPTLYRQYEVIMAANDYLYFTMDNMIDQMSRTGEGVAGKFELENIESEESDSGEENDGPDTKVKAYGLIFPILCHEVVKGLEEVQGRHSYSQKPGMAGRVLKKTDVLYKEPMQLRIGPELVTKINMVLPDEVFEPENYGLMRWFKIILYRKPAKDFLEIFQSLISENNELAKKMFIEILKEAKERKKEYDDYVEYQKTHGSSSTDSDDSSDSGDDDDGFDDFLSGLGITRNN
jgi:hypothetical protein